MRDLASCFSEHAVRVADASCSGSRSGGSAAASFAAGVGSDYHAAVPSIQTSTFILFKSKLSSGKPLLVQLTWSRSHEGPSLAIGVDDGPELISPWKASCTRSKMLRLKKGAHFFPTTFSAIALHWDFSSASFGAGPEPVDNFYVAVMIDAEVALLLGDRRGEFLERFSGEVGVAEFSMVCRKEQVVGSALHSVIRAQIDSGGKYHEITIRCRGGRWEGEEAELSVSVDNNRVAHVAKLKWNFRGNQTIFVDGSPVDLMWDMHGWWFGGLPEHAVFLFRRRGALESRLWLAEEQGPVEFSLLIQAFRSPRLL